MSAGVIASHYVAGPTTYDGIVLADGPSVYLKLDELSGTTLNDASTNGRNFVLSSVSTASVANIRPGGVRAISFGNTVSDHGKCAGASWMQQSAFTIEAWVKLNDVSALHAICSRDSNVPRGWTLYAWSTGNFAFFDTSGTAHTGSTALSTGTVYHVVATATSANGTGTATVKLYVNGSLDGTFTSVALNNIDATVLDMYITASQAGTGGTSLFFPLNGTMDDFAFYPTALTATQVSAHYAARNS